MLERCAILLVYFVLSVTSKAIASDWTINKTDERRLQKERVVLLGDIHDDPRNYSGVSAEQRERNAAIGRFVESIADNYPTVLLVERPSYVDQTLTDHGLDGLHTYGINLQKSGNNIRSFGWDSGLLKELIFDLLKEIPKTENPIMQGVYADEIEILVKMRSYFMFAIAMQYRNENPSSVIIVVSGSEHVTDGIASDLFKEKKIKPIIAKGNASEKEDIAPKMPALSVAQREMLRRQKEVASEFVQELIQRYIDKRWVSQGDIATYLKFCDSCLCVMRKKGILTD